VEDEGAVSDTAEEAKSSSKAPKQTFSEIKKLVARFEPSGSQYKLVEELYTYFLKPLVDGLSMIQVSDNEDIRLIDGYRPLNDVYEEKILQRRMQAMKKYADSVKKLEEKRRAEEGGGDAAGENSKFYDWLQTNTAATCEAMYLSMSSPRSPVTMPPVSPDIGKPDARCRINRYIDKAFESLLGQEPVDPGAASRIFAQLCKKRSIVCKPHYRPGATGTTGLPVISLAKATSADCVPSKADTINMLKTLKWDPAIKFPIKCRDENMDDTYGQPGL